MRPFRVAFRTRTLFVKEGVLLMHQPQLRTEETDKRAPITVKFEIPYVSLLSLAKVLPVADLALTFIDNQLLHRFRYPSPISQGCRKVGLRRTALGPVRS